MSILIILVVLEVFLVILKVFMGILLILIVLGFSIILKVSKHICIWAILVVFGYFYHFFYHIFFMNKQSSLRQKEYTKKFTPTKQVAIKLQTPQIIYIILTVSWGYFGNLDVVEIL